MLSSEPAVKEILSQYGQSFKEMLQFENAENDPETHLKFTETITNIKQRHQVNNSLVQCLMLNLKLIMNIAFGL